MRLRHMLGNLRIGVKLTLSLLVGVMILIGLAVASISRGVDNLMQQSGHRRIEEEARLIQRRFEEQRGQVLFETELLASNSAVMSAAASGDATTVRSALLINSSLLELDQAHYVDKEANYLSVDPGIPQLTELFDYGVLGISMTAVIPGDPYMLTAVVPVRDRGGQIIGALSGGRGLTDQFLTEIDFGRSEVLLALVSQTEIVAMENVTPTGATDPLAMLGGSLQADMSEAERLGEMGLALDYAAVARALDGEVVYAEDFLYDGEGTPYAAAYVPLKVGAPAEVGVAVMVDLNALETFRDKLATEQTITLIVLAVLIVLGLVASVWQFVTRPLSRLKLVAGELRQGDYTRRAEILNRDEVGELAISFNEMADAIQQRDGELRQQATDLRIATSKAREAARVKSEFLANMSHELRTPLNAIIGFSDMLLLGMSGELNEKQQHKIQRLRENGTRLLDLVNNILDITRIEAKRIELINKPFEPRALVKRLSEQMAVLAEKNNLAFETLVADEVPESLEGDEKRIEQIVVNLLSNAFKFTKTGSVKLAVAADLPARTWSLAVTDTGIGIPLHARDIIFEEFRQLDGTPARAYQGSGLGLAITRNLVRIMEGQITVESELSQGSTFTVTLPIRTVTTEEKPAEPVLETVGT